MGATAWSAANLSAFPNIVPGHAMWHFPTTNSLLFLVQRVQVGNLDNIAMRLMPIHHPGVPTETLSRPFSSIFMDSKPSPQFVRSGMADQGHIEWNIGDGYVLRL